MRSLDFLSYEKDAELYKIIKGRYLNLENYIIFLFILKKPGLLLKIKK